MARGDLFAGVARLDGVFARAMAQVEGDGAAAGRVGLQQRRHGLVRTESAPLAQLLREALDGGRDGLLGHERCDGCGVVGGLLRAAQADPARQLLAAQLPAVPAVLYQVIALDQNLGGQEGVDLALDGARIQRRGLSCGEYHCNGLAQLAPVGPGDQVGQGCLDIQFAPGLAWVDGHAAALQR